MRDPSQQPKQMDSHGIVNVLTKKPFYSHRFLDQIKGLYPSSPAIAPMLYVKSLLTGIPDQHANQVIALTVRKIVDQCVECPGPSELRKLMAEAILEASGTSYEKLYEQAKTFLALPPISQATAERWLERVIYSAIRKDGREHFMSMSPDAWKSTISELLLSDRSTLHTYQVKAPTIVEAKKRDFTKLLKS